MYHLFKNAALLSSSCDSFLCQSALASERYSEVVGWGYRKTLTKELTQQVGIFEPSFLFLLPTWNTDMMEGTATATM
jgi:hypothetical protein